MERILGIIEGEEPGPLVICIAGIHGNEQVGIHAFRNVFSSIIKHRIPLKGKLVGLAGNLRAIENNVRFLDYDLNRCWTSPIIQAVLDDTYGTASENEELRELYQIIERESQGNYHLKVIADLHATSADKGNFVVVPDDENDHPIIQGLRLPVVVGLEKYLEGTLLSYYHHHDYITFAFEGGTIGTEDVYRLHTSGLWEILDNAGAITHHDHEKEDHYSNELANVAANFPEKVEIIFRHKVEVGDGFKMLPGFHNFQPIKKDQLLALDNRGKIRSPCKGLIFMPLYQSAGEDGFFVVVEI